MSYVILFVLTHIIQPTKVKNRLNIFFNYLNILKRLRLILKLNQLEDNSQILNAEFVWKLKIWLRVCRCAEEINIHRITLDLSYFIKLIENLIKVNQTVYFSHYSLKYFNQSGRNCKHIPVLILRQGMGSRASSAPFVYATDLSEAHQWNWLRSDKQRETRNRLLNSR